MKPTSEDRPAAGQDPAAQTDTEETGAGKPAEKQIPAQATLRDFLYGRINVSLKTMDIFIAVIVAAIVIVLAVGIIQARTAQ